MLNPDQQSKLTIFNTMLLSVLLMMGIIEHCDSKSRTDSLTPDVVQMNTAPSEQENPQDASESKELEQKEQPVTVTNKVAENTGTGLLEKSSPLENTMVMTIAELIEVTIQPLRAAGDDHEEDVVRFLPTPEELDAANATESLESEASKIVLAKIAKGYEHFNMPFPSLPTAPIGSAGIKNSETSPGVPPSNSSPETDASKDPAAVRSYLLPTIERLQTELSLNGMNDDGLIPLEAEISAAINSGSFTSDASLVVLGKLRSGFKDSGLDFPEPGTITIGQTAPPPTQLQGPSSESANGAAGPPPNGTGGGSTFDQQEVIVRAYFEGQIQRVKMLAEQSGTDISHLLPSVSDIEDAAKTGKIESPESRLAIDKLASAYSILDEPFNPPINEQ